MRLLRKSQLVGGIVVGLCALGLYVGIRCLPSGSSAEPLAIVTLDCSYVSDPNSDYFPVITSYPAAGDTSWRWGSERDALRAKFGRVGHVARYKVIAGKEYFGTKIFTGELDSYQEPQATILEFYRRPSEGDSPPIDMYLNTKITCELRIENFQGGRVRDFESKEPLTPPYVFTAAEYHLEAVIDRSGNAR